MHTGIHVDLATLRSEWETQHRKSADAKLKGGAGVHLGGVHLGGVHLGSVAGHLMGLDQVPVQTRSIACNNQSTESGATVDIG